MKFIPAEKLIAEIERRKKELFEVGGDTFENKWACGSLDNIKAFVISLQQEQTEFSNGKLVFPKYLYARTKDNKTIDVSYVPQDMTAVEYIRSDFVQQEQENVAERFAKIVRGNLIGIDKEAQQKFEQIYFEVTGNKMYGGYND